MAADGLPQRNIVVGREPLDPPVAALERHRSRTRRRPGIDRRADRLAGEGVRL